MAVLAKPMRKYMKASSLPVFLRERYGASVSKVQAYIWIIFGILYIPIQLKTVASVIQMVLPGISINWAMLIGVTIAAAYTGFAGMKGSDIIGRIVCIATYILLIGFVVTNLDDFHGYSGLLAKLPEGYNNLTAMPVQQIIAWALGGALTSIVSQAALQPMFAAKSDHDATWGCVLGYVIAGPICILTAIIGMMAKANTNSLGDGASAFAWSIAHLTSPLLAGIIFAVITMIVAATMATMMMATGTVISNVYSTQINPQATDKSGIAGIPERDHHRCLHFPVRRFPDSFRPNGQYVPDLELPGVRAFQLYGHRRDVLERGYCQGFPVQHCRRDYRGPGLDFRRSQLYFQRGVSHHCCQLYCGLCGY